MKTTHKLDNYVGGLAIMSDDEKLFKNFLVQFGLDCIHDRELEEELYNHLENNIENKEPYTYKSFPIHTILYKSSNLKEPV